MKTPNQETLNNSRLTSEILNIPRETIPNVMNNVAVRIKAVIGQHNGYIIWWFKRRGLKTSKWKAQIENSALNQKLT